MGNDILLERLGVDRKKAFETVYSDDEAAACMEDLRAAMLATLATVTAIGTQALAAHQIVWTLWTFAAYVLDALAIAAQALVGFAEGRGDRGGMAPLLRTLARWGTAFGALVGVVLGAASPWLPALFTADPAVRGPASWAIVVGALFQPLAGLVFLLDGILIGAGRGRFLAAASLVNLTIYAPLLWLIARSSSTGALADSPVRVDVVDTDRR